MEIFNVDEALGLEKIETQNSYFLSHISTASLKPTKHYTGNPYREKSNKV